MILTCEKVYVTVYTTDNKSIDLNNMHQGTKIFKYCTYPAGRVTYNFHLSCKRMHMSFKSVCNKEHK